MAKSVTISTKAADNIVAQKRKPADAEPIATVDWTCERAYSSIRHDLVERAVDHIRFGLGSSLHTAVAARPVGCSDGALKEKLPCVTKRTKMAEYVRQLIETSLSNR